VTPGFIIAVLAGVVVGQLLFRGAVIAARRLGYAQRIEARVNTAFDGIYNTLAAGSDVLRSDAFLMVVWAILSIVVGVSFFLGMQSVLICP